MKQESLFLRSISTFLKVLFLKLRFSTINYGELTSENTQRSKELAEDSTNQGDLGFRSGAVQNYSKLVDEPSDCRFVSNGRELLILFVRRQKFKRRQIMDYRHYQTLLVFWEISAASYRRLSLLLFNFYFVALLLNFCFFNFLLEQLDTSDRSNVSSLFLVFAGPRRFRCTVFTHSTSQPSFIPNPKFSSCLLNGRPTEKSYTNHHQLLLTQLSRFMITVAMNPPEQQERLTQYKSKVADKLDFHAGPWRRVS